MAYADGPYTSFNFLIEVDGQTVMGFSECGGLDSCTDVIDYREGVERTHTRKLAGLHSAGPVTLKRGVTQGLELWQWRKTVLDGATERRQVKVTLLDASRQPAAAWVLGQAWPSKYSGPTLRADESDVALETLELTVESIERVQ